MLTPSAVTSTPHLQSPFVFPASRKPAASDAPTPAGVPMSFGRNAEIYAEGETSGYVYKVVSGVVRVSKLLPDGRRQISAFHLPGEMFGFEAEDVHHASAEAVVPDQGHRLQMGWRAERGQAVGEFRARASEPDRARA